MKIRDGYVLKTVAGENLVIPCNGDLNFDQMITLNDTGSFIWKKLEKETSQEEIVSALLNEYEVDEAQAISCVNEFIGRLKELNFVE